MKRRNVIMSALVLLISAVTCQCMSSSLQIDADFPGGNIKVISINGDSIQLQQDLRDTQVNWNWFYWSFRVRGAAGRTLNFKFTNGPVICSRGPAISNDGGTSWRWLGDSAGSSSTGFRYCFGADEHEVYFSQVMNYTEKDLRSFLGKYKNHPNLSVETLCTSRKGRNVELLLIQNDNRKADSKIVLTTRHHCGETMATYALEGIIETVLSDTENGVWLRKHADFFIVPFVDKDGVEDGDQGKCRHPHDHNRDYTLQIYPEIRAITGQVPKWLDDKPVFFLDLHCPSLGDETVYFVGLNPEVCPEKMEEKLHQFGAVLETVRKGAIPYKASSNLPYGQSWNKEESYKITGRQKSVEWGATLPQVILASSLEIPFANASGVLVDANSARAFGHDLACAINVYLESLISK